MSNSKMTIGFSTVLKTISIFYWMDTCYAVNKQIYPSVMSMYLCFCLWNEIQTTHSVPAIQQTNEVIIIITKCQHIFYSFWLHVSITKTEWTNCHRCCLETTVNGISVAFILYIFWILWIQFVRAIVCIYILNLHLIGWVLNSPN